MIHILQYINSFVSSGKGGEESINEIVLHHLTDQIPSGWIFWDFINKINQKYLSKISISFFGTNLDMRITKLVFMMWLTALLSLIIFIPVARKIKKSSMGSESKWVNLWEALIGFVHDEIVEPNFDHKYVNKAMPYFCTLFFFILFANLFGLIPLASTSTGNLAVTGGLAFLTLLGVFIIGTIKQGPLYIFKGIVPGGIPLFLLPMLWAIELIGIFIKPIVLTVRLFANMVAGHIVILIFLYLTIMFKNYFVGLGSVTGSLIIYLLELLVAFIQAYIFATLSAMYIGASMHAH